ALVPPESSRLVLEKSVSDGLTTMHLLVERRGGLAVGRIRRTIVIAAVESHRCSNDLNQGESQPGPRQLVMDDAGKIRGQCLFVGRIERRHRARGDDEHRDMGAKRKRRDEEGRPMNKSRLLKGRLGMG